MRWCVIRHPSGLVAHATESALPVHRGAGWSRVSEWAGDRDSLDLADFSDLVDLDAPKAVPAVPDPPVKTSKESKS